VPTTVVVVFTARPLDEILKHGGSRDWRLDPERARRAEYLVCTHNRHNTVFRAPTAPHRAAILIGRIADVVPSPEAPDRWLIKISEYCVPAPPIPNIWGKSGHRRYPVWYTTLEELGIDLSTLPPFRPMTLSGSPGGMHEMPVAPVIAPANASQMSPSQLEQWADRPARAQSAGGQDVWRRLDAILQQIDRVPDLPTPNDPLDWDEHGLPR
jgi:hypothetical protein